MREFPLSIQPLKHEIRLMAVGFLVVEAIEPHIRLADFLGAVVKRIRRVHSASNNHTLRRCEHQSVASDNGFRSNFVDF